MRPAFVGGFTESSTQSAHNYRRRAAVVPFYAFIVNACL